MARSFRRGGGFALIRPEPCWPGTGAIFDSKLTPNLSGLAGESLVRSVTVSVMRRGRGLACLGIKWGGDGEGDHPAAADVRRRHAGFVRRREQVVDGQADAAGGGLPGLAGDAVGALDGGVGAAREGPAARRPDPARRVSSGHGPRCWLAEGGGLTILVVTAFQGPSQERPREWERLSSVQLLR